LKDAPFADRSEGALTNLRSFEIASNIKKLKFLSENIKVLPLYYPYIMTGKKTDSQANWKS
jgi:hypothetical protein